MLVQQPSLITHVRDGSFEGENAWFALLRSFTNILGDPHLQSTYVIIDALGRLGPMASFSCQAVIFYSHVKWIVSSRNWPSIENNLNGPTQLKILLELNEDTLSAAFDSFIQHKITELAEKKSTKNTWCCPASLGAKGKRHFPLGGLGLRGTRQNLEVGCSEETEYGIYSHLFIPCRALKNVARW